MIKNIIFLLMYYRHKLLDIIYNISLKCWSQWKILNLKNEQG
jgi:hypothetical protein